MPGLAARSLCLAVALVGASTSIASAQPTDLRIAPGDGELVISWTEVSPTSAHDVYLAAEPGVLADTVDSLSLGRSVLGASSPLTVRGLTFGRRKALMLTLRCRPGSCTTSTSGGRRC